MLEYVGVDPKRFQARWISGSEGQKFAETATQMTEDIRELGPNRKLRDAK
ncbi:coenzyme F420-reducing hydrogenase delta subunit [Desulfitispora alkaliphila]